MGRFLSNFFRVKTVRTDFTFYSSGDLNPSTSSRAALNPSTSSLSRHFYIYFCIEEIVFIKNNDDGHKNFSLFFSRIVRIGMLKKVGKKTGPALRSKSSKLPFTIFCVESVVFKFHSPWKVEIQLESVGFKSPQIEITADCCKLLQIVD